LSLRRVGECRAFQEGSVKAKRPTSSTNRVYPGEAVVTVGEQESKAVADQIMAVDKSRLKDLLGTLSREDMTAVEHAIKVHLALPL
jgi:mRNA interferase MazF